MLKVDVKNGNIEGALKFLKRKVRKVKQVQQLRDNEQFTKPSVIKREQKKDAIYKEKKINEEEDYD